MMLLVALHSLVLLIGAHAANEGAARTFHPRRLSLESLSQQDNDLLDALSVDGIVSITNVPNFDNYKNAVMQTMHTCALASKETKIHQFSDGTRRLTMASHTVLNGMQPLKHESDECREFETASDEYRRSVSLVTQELANRMAVVTKEPLLRTASGYTFDTLREVVQAGEHLEHFHSYQKLAESSSSSSANAAAATATIDLHTDQGLFIVFSPGRITSLDGADSVPSSGFFIETPDGSIAQVEFDDEDDLIIMLGDGVNQYVNPKLSESSPQLRAVPHSLVVPDHDANQVRVWYGRMVLAPADAIYPAHDVTFGNLRNRMIDASYASEIESQSTLSLGCSGSRIARELTDQVTCGANALYCWHQCMDFDDYNVTEDDCTSRDLQLQCINPRLQISNGTLHGDYYPGCVAKDAEMETPIPKLDSYPRDDDACTTKDFLAFSTDSDYNHTAVLLENVSVLQWNVRQDSSGEMVLDARLSFNGLFGFLGLGFASSFGELHGMLGAKVLLARPGDNYTGYSGLDLSGGPNVHEFQIDSEQTPFRVWMTSESEIAAPSGSEFSSSIVNSSDCFTSMKIVTSSIKGQAFNSSGTDEMLWAANGQDYYMMYHGANRGRFSLHWPTGEVELLSKPPFSEESASTVPPSGEESGSQQSQLSVSGLVAAMLLGLVAIA
ncbi:hypothetical protein MPSEU_000022900 [Mayamaea pseudoterrestris]|nr:hypothetical protein MPSEU_000022900 [Mayamaea pseudoterrestris]